MHWNYTIFEWFVLETRLYFQTKNRKLTFIRVLSEQFAWLKIQFCDPLLFWGVRFGVLLHVKAQIMNFCSSHGHSYLEIINSWERCGTGIPRCAAKAKWVISFTCWAFILILKPWIRKSPSNQQHQISLFCKPYKLSMYVF